MVLRISMVGGTKLTDINDDYGDEINRGSQMMTRGMKTKRKKENF